MLLIAGKTARPIGLNFFEDTHGFFFKFFYTVNAGTFNYLSCKMSLKYRKVIYKKLEFLCQIWSLIFPESF